MLCNNFKAQYSYFSHRRKLNVPTSLQNKRKQKMSILALSKDFSAVSADGRDVIAYGLNSKKY